MSGETWKPVGGFEGLYAVSNLGRVKSLKRNTTSGGIMKTHINRGYEYVHLCKDGKHYNAKVHRLVASAFVGNPMGKPEVNHLDEDKTNNRADNLEWVTAKENSRHGTKAERVAQKTRKKIVQMDLNGVPIKTWESSVAIEKETGFRASNIRTVCCGKTKSAYGFKWAHLNCMDSYRMEVLPE